VKEIACHRVLFPGTPDLWIAIFLFEPTFSCAELKGERLPQLSPSVFF
jgi:hypothetical protein